MFLWQSLVESTPIAKAGVLEVIRSWDVACKQFAIREATSDGCWSLVLYGFVAVDTYPAHLVEFDLT